MESTFGARLRAQRERQQVALATIANQTKIRVSLLEELEKDDVTHWPHGIFRRSYVRSYALAIGLEPDAVAREFLELYPDTLDYTPEAVAAARGIDVQTAKQSPPTRLKFLLHPAFEAVPALRADPATARTPPAESAPAAEVHRAPAAAKSEPQPAPLPEPSAPAAARSEPPSPAATTESAPAPPASTPPAIEPPSVAPPAVESPAIEPPAEHPPAGVNLSEVARLRARRGRCPVAARGSGRRVRGGRAHAVDRRRSELAHRSSRLRLSEWPRQAPAGARRRSQRGGPRLSVGGDLRRRRPRCFDRCDRGSDHHRGWLCWRACAGAAASTRAAGMRARGSDDRRRSAVHAHRFTIPGLRFSVGRPRRDSLIAARSTRLRFAHLARTPDSRPSLGITGSD